jgi:hypothetical protein
LIGKNNIYYYYIYSQFFTPTIYVIQEERTDELEAGERAGGGTHNDRTEEITYELEAKLGFINH